MMNCLVDSKCEFLEEGRERDKKKNLGAQLFWLIIDFYLSFYKITCSFPSSKWSYINMPTPLFSFTQLFIGFLSIIEMALTTFTLLKRLSVLTVHIFTCLSITVNKIKGTLDDVLIRFFKLMRLINFNFHALHRLRRQMKKRYAIFIYQGRQPCFVVYLNVYTYFAVCVMHVPDTL